MSFGGFGQNNQQQQGSGFGGFGTNNNTGSGFGQQPPNTGFGSGSSLFGGNNSNTGSGFGTGGTSAFGSTTSNATPFGQSRPAFGAAATSGGSGLFGGNTATAGSGGFGGFGNSNNSTTTGGGLFGAQKPAFAGANSAGGAFGGGANSRPTFGSTNNQQTGTFGAPLSSALSVQNAECQGTGSTPFSAYTEKEGTGNMTNHFQSISFMAPYKNFSFEELRNADYNQGRRFGNASGQAGAFGQTNFGGFGQQGTTGGFGQATNNTGGGLFGQPTTTSASPFSSSQPAQSGFGTGGSSLFGQKPQPQTNSLFGQANPASSSQQSGGIFGTSAAGGFGSGTNTGTGFGGGTSAFGGATQQQQSKSPFSFGGAGGSTGGFGSGGSGFGSANTTNNNTGSGLFGQTNPPFGQQQQPAQSSNPFGSFGQPNQGQTNTQSPFGGFGQPQDTKPGGIFGNQPATNTGGSNLFGTATQGNNQPQPTGGSIFGNTGSNQASNNSLFAPKPAATGTNLFGTNNASTSNAGGGLFGGFGNNNNQNQQNPGNSLFGNNNAQQQKPGSVFGNTTSGTGGGLFNNLSNNNANNQQPAGSSLFGSNNQQQQQPGNLFGNTANNQGSSLFGSQQQQQLPNALQYPQAMQASLTDPNNAYGSPSIFSGLPPPPQVVSPIATPINVKQKMKKSVIQPNYKSAPNAASRLVTPQKRGFGFSYSTYGTPGSVSSNASTPGGLGSSLLYGSVGRGLGKSLSTSNLRRNFDSDSESILTPGAFTTPGHSRYGGAGSLKRLTIDRSLRTDLFGDRGAAAALPSPEKNDQSKQPGILKKKVSFDASTVGGNGGGQDGDQGNATHGNYDKASSTPSAEEQGFLRTPSRAQNRLAAQKSNGVPTQSETEQVRGNELAIVHEDESSEPSSSANTRILNQQSQDDQQPGSYWMKPSEKEIQKMSKEEQKHISNYIVGRHGCGRVEFNTPVDLSVTPVNDIYGSIVLIELRSLTVYPDQTKKPAQGKGLNVPSTLYLENSWPRQKDRRTLLHEKSGPRFNKHVDRLRKVGGTEFVRYEKDTGIWVFKVPHFTTYGFDYEEDASEGESLQTSILSQPPDTPTPKSHIMRSGLTTTATLKTHSSVVSRDGSSYVTSSLDDTFEFRKRKMLPGAFDDLPMFDEEHAIEGKDPKNEKPFLGRRLAASPLGSGEDESSEVPGMSDEDENGSLMIGDEDPDMTMETSMVGAFPSPDPDEPRSITRLGYSTPGKGALGDSDDWAESLQRTISPRKQDRQALREIQTRVLGNGEVDAENRSPATLNEKGTPRLTTSIDLMNSLFGQEQARRSGGKAKQVTKGQENGLKWPYTKLSTTRDDAESEKERSKPEYRASYKPRWGPGETLLYAIPGKVDSSRNQISRTGASQMDQRGAIVSQGRDIRFAKLGVISSLISQTLVLQRALTSIVLDQEVPMANNHQTPFKDIASAVQPNSDYEKSIWELASILFDEQDPKAYGVPTSQKATYDHRIRKDRLSKYWEQLCHPLAKKAVGAAPNAEERAISHLSSHNVVDACDALAQGKDFRLATLVAQIGGDQIMRDDMTVQIDAWRDLNVLSEMTEPIRALYSLLAGNTGVCEGKKGPLEDRARTFIISERFNLDWKRAFGLRLWYAIQAEDHIENAVVNYENDLRTHEAKLPVPWFVEEGIQIPRVNGDVSEREDVRWGLLKLYAASKSALQLPSLAAVFAPHNTVGNPLDVRLSFQLYYAFTFRFPSASDPGQADAFAYSFATQLESAGEWIWSIFALLHLSLRPQRQRDIQTVLSLHAADIQTEPPHENFRVLTEDLQIPASWIYSAKALYARSVQQDHVSEVQYLVRAQDWDEAHKALKREVGPMAVIEEDWDMLQSVIGSFKSGKNQIQDWGLGGQVYDDYLSLINGVSGREKSDILERLLGALPLMVQGDRTQFRERVAVQEMSGLVGMEVRAMERKGIEGARVLNLPLTDDAHHMHTMQMSLQYYRAVMAGGY